jgi:tetratricopeptide (TPR) repeat protein
MFIAKNFATIFKMVFILVLLLTNGGFMAAYGQNTAVDSLKRELEKHREEDTVRVWVLIELANAYFAFDLNQSPKYLDEATQIVDGNKTPFSLIRINTTYSNYYNLIGNFDKAISYLDKSIVLSKKHNFQQTLWKCQMMKGLAMVDRKDTEKAKNILFLAIKEAKDENFYEREMPTIWANISQCYVSLGNYDSALITNAKAIAIAKKLKDNEVHGDALNNRHIIYKRLNNNEKALECLFEAEKIWTKLGYTTKQALVTYNIGDFYNNVGNFDLAEEYYKKALDIKLKSGNSDVGLNYEGLAALSINKGQETDAQKYLDKAIISYQKLKDTLGIAYVGYTKASLLINKENYKEAKPYLLSSLPIMEQSGDIRYYVSILKSLSKCYIVEKNYKEAENTIKRAIKVAKKYNMLPQLKEQYAIIPVLYVEQSNLDKSIQDTIYHYLNLTYALVDTVAKNRYEGVVADKLTKYETEKKEAQIKELALQNELEKKENEQQWYLFGVGLLLLVLLVSFGFYYVLNRKEKEKLQAKQDAQTEERAYLSMQAHDELISPIETLATKYPAMATEVATIAQKVRFFSHRIAKYDSELLTSRLYEYVGGYKEKGIELIASFTGGDEFVKQIPPNIAEHLYIIADIALLNVEKHAKTSKVWLDFHCDAQNIILSIKDTGIGFNKDVVKKNTGRGLKNIEERAKRIGATAIIDSYSSGELKGTEITVRLPFKKL